MLVLLPLLGVFLSSQPAAIEANLSLNFKVTKISRHNNSGANCNVGNTTYAHGETFKLDCKTQCVCENGRHACSSLCPKEQLPAPEDTISCRSPRLVEVPGHCCKMWLCENPTADVYATCHNASTSPWTACSNACGLGISTRFASTNTGCGQLSSLRLCANRKCLKDNNIGDGQTKQPTKMHHHQLGAESYTHNLYAAEQQHQAKEQQLQHHLSMHHHKIRKGHECRSIERLGSARIRLGQCVSRKLYRPKICGYCLQSNKCCLPTVSTTIQVEVLCPLNSEDPIAYAKQQALEKGRPLWDTQSLEPIDQEFLQSHQIQIENKFISVEWVLKCECSQNDSCDGQTMARTNETGNLDKFKNFKYNDYKNNNKNNKNKIRNKKNRKNRKKQAKQQYDYKNEEYPAAKDHKYKKISKDTEYDDNNNNNNYDNHNDEQFGNAYNHHYDHGNDDDVNDDKHNNINVRGLNLDNVEDLLKFIETSTKQDTNGNNNAVMASDEEGTSLSSELQPDIIPYPPYPKMHQNSHHNAYNNKHHNGKQNDDSNRNSNNNSNNNANDKTYNKKVQQKPYQYKQT